MKGKLMNVIIGKVQNGFTVIAEWENTVSTAEKWADEIEEKYVFVTKEEAIAKVAELLV